MKTFITSIFLLSCSFLFSQKFNGTLLSPSQKPISNANVILMSLPDSTLVKGAISNEKGQFEIQNPSESKDLLLKITHLEYKDKILSAKNTNLGSIVLIPSTNELGEIVLSATKPLMKQKGSRIKTTIAETSLAKIPQTFMILNFLPGVTASVSGDFEVFGKEGVVFYINNRRVRDMIEIFRLSPQEIESIEIETQPGAEHDNSVGAVIYIRLKKKQGDGLSGVVASQYNFKNKGSYGHSILSLNYRTGKTDIFVDTYLNYNYDNVTKTEQNLSANTPNDQWQVNTSEIQKANDKNVYAKTGFAHEINDNHSLGASFSFYINPFSGHSYNEQETETYKNNTLIGKGLNTYDAFNQNKTFMSNAYYEGKLSDKIKMQTDIDYMGIRSNNNSNILTTNKLNNTSLPIEKHSTARSDWGSIKTIFTQKIGQKAGISYGIEASSLNRNEEYQDTQSASPKIENKETRSAAFISFVRPIKKVVFKAGLRYEYADYGYYEDNQKNDVKSKTYKDFLPNVSVSFPWKKTDLTLSYARKITRPAFYELNDFSTYESPFLYSRGNSNITPKFVEDITLLTTYKNLSFSLNYQYVEKGYYQEYRLSSIPNVVEKTLRNFDNYHRIKAVVSGQYKVGKWLPKATFSFGKQFADGIFEKNTPILSIQWENQYIFSEKWVGILEANYFSKGSIDDTYYNKSITNIIFVLSRSLYQNKMQIFGGIEYVLNTPNKGSEITNPFISNKIYTDNYHPNIFVAFLYNFNSTQSKYKGHSAAEEEKSRM
ncbi:MAG: outer membrane beta-barrel family protein [Capnocytophaga sp.]|nr:outer membrane beta-barrel family protein [Capnocytophaga sp.]